MKMKLDLYIFCLYKIIYNFGWFNYFGKRGISYVVVLRFLYCVWNQLNWGMRLKDLIKKEKEIIILDRACFVSEGAPYAFMVWVRFVRCFTADWIKSRLNAKIN